MTISKRKQFTKIGKFEIALKGHLRQLRMNRGLDMNVGSTAIGVSRKQLEDIETIRNYGCHITANLLQSYAKYYGNDELLGAMEAALEECDE